MDRKSIKLAPKGASLALGEPRIAPSEKSDLRLGWFAAFHHWLSASDDANLYRAITAIAAVGFLFAAVFAEVSHV